MREWSHFTIFSEVYISLDICSGFEYDSFLEIDISFYRDICFYSSAEIESLFISSDDHIICLEEIPWIAYSDPSSFCLYDRVALFSHVFRYEIGDLELSSRRERKLTKIIEDATIEFMIADISEIPKRWIGRLFYDTLRLTI
jgi:hypothetical protein